MFVQEPLMISNVVSHWYFRQVTRITTLSWCCITRKPRLVSLVLPNPRIFKGYVIDEFFNNWSQKDTVIPFGHEKVFSAVIHESLTIPKCNTPPDAKVMCCVTPVIGIWNWGWLVALPLILRFWLTFCKGQYLSTERNSSSMRSRCRSKNGSRWDELKLLCAWKLRLAFTKNRVRLGSSPEMEKQELYLHFWFTEFKFARSRGTLRLMRQTTNDMSKAHLNGFNVCFNMHSTGHS